MAVVAAVVVVAGGLGVAFARRDGSSSWTASATAACDARARTVEVASAQLTLQSTPEQYQVFYETFFVPAYRTQLDAMRAADPPDESARRLIDDTAAVVDRIAADPRSFATAADPFVDVDARWDAAGLPACGTRPAAEASR